MHHPATKAECSFGPFQTVLIANTIVMATQMHTTIARTALAEKRHAKMAPL